MALLALAVFLPQSQCLQMSPAFAAASKCSSKPKPTVNLSGCKLGAVRWSGVNLAGADLSRASLVNADLSRANLTGANLSGANFTGANLTAANLSRAGILGATVNKAKLANANLTGLRGSAQVFGAPASLPRSWVFKNGGISPSGNQSSVSVGLFCVGYKKYLSFYMKYLDYNLDSLSGGSRLTTGNPAVKTALKMVRDLKPLALTKEQKEWVVYATRFFTLVDSGKPTKWSAGDPDSEVDWLALGWTKDPGFEWNQPLADLGPYQATLAVCLKPQ